MRTDAGKQSVAGLDWQAAAHGPPVAAAAACSSSPRLVVTGVNQGRGPARAPAEEF
eukprot:COSAG03_NODE_6825_length_1000_cov_1.651498_1_plen_55_part_10